MSYNFNSRITWEEFKGWPLDIQQEYADWFVDRWGLGLSYMARMFVVSVSTVTKYFHTAGLKFRPKLKGTMTDRMAFEAWLRGEPENKDEPDPEVQTPAARDDEPIKMKGGTLHFEGSVAAILEAVYKIIGDGTGKISVQWDIE